MACTCVMVVAVIVVLGFVMICLNVLIEGSGTRNERLSYPIIQLPMAIVEEAVLQGFSKIDSYLSFCDCYWIGHIKWLAFPVSRCAKYPGIISWLRHRQVFHVKTMERNRFFKASALSFAIGLGFFLPLDLSFSICSFTCSEKLKRCLVLLLGFRHCRVSLPEPTIIWCVIGCSS